MGRSASAQTRKYLCSESDRNPATMMRTIYGDIPVIRWTSGRYLAGQSPQQRCESAANGLQRAFDRNASLLRADELGQGQPVICAVSVDSEHCSHANTILSLNSDTDSNTAMVVLLNIRWLSSLNPLYQSDDLLLFAKGGFNYSNISALEEALICSEYPSASECISD